MKVRLNQIIILLAATFTGVTANAFAKDGSGGSSGGRQVGFDTTYHPNSQYWVRGHKEDASYSFKGASWMLYATSSDVIKTAATNISSPLTLAIWGSKLESYYQGTDESPATETIGTQGIGAGYIGDSAGGGVCGMLVVGAERAYIDRTGNSPASQFYPLGLAAKVGFGISPFSGRFAACLRGDWEFTRYAATEWNDTSLKDVDHQSFAPTLSFSVRY
jgi:hypothetical protein